MSITIKSQSEIALMREAGRILAIVHEEMAKIIQPGVTTYQIDRVGEEVIRSYGCTPACLHYEGFPASICISINEEVVHGIPSKKRHLKEGDIVSLDTALCYKGYHSDAARTHAVGEVSPKAKRLMRITQECFYEGIRYARAGCHLNDISTAIGSYAEKNGCGVVRDLSGHGIGEQMHEDPQIANFRQLRRGPKLRAGMTLAIEPMITLGTWRVEWLDDDWTVVTQDHSLAAHYENTVLITDGDPEILSLKKE
ncbi:MAG: type I methionyl aminopeptidase [Lachnospiraceae bacterium]|nr:type I methionyl aminopeptidase [Lachnospiraceae bacterium]